MQPSTQPYRRPPNLPREHSRRGRPRSYILKRLSRDALRARHAQRPPAAVEALVDAAKAGSALRSRLVAAGIDPKLARLALLFYRWDQLRPADVAWRLGVSPATASRWLDRAERLGLVEKLYHDFDRRGTWARLTISGAEFRESVECVVATVRSTDRPAGVVYGIRAHGWDW